MALMRWALGIEYDGMLYQGWQSQPHGQTVQDTLEKALTVIAGMPIRVIAAGRTDTGVHATEQVVHFDTELNRPVSAWVRGVNSHLPKDIAVLWAKPVSVDFHARFSAYARRYRYELCNRPIRPAISQGKVGWYHAPLDLALMQQAAQYLLGEQDFSAFRAAECQAKSPIKTLLRLEITRQGELFYFDVQANAFLHHMVRNLVGALVYIGAGKHPPEWIISLLASRSRALAPPTFSPAGLYLIEVSYPSSAFNLL